MRIAVNTRMLLKHRMEGICRYIHETTKRIVQAHPEHEFYFFFDRPFHPGFIYGPNVTPVVLPPPTRDPILWKIWFDYIIPRALKKYKIDVFLSGDTYMSLRSEVPTVLVSHDIAYHHFPDHLPKRVLNYYERHFPTFHQKAKRIIAVSEYTKQDIIEAYNLDPAKISVAYNATPEGFSVFTDDEKKACRNTFTQGKPFFIYVGAIHPRKNVPNLIQGFLEFKKKGSNHKLVILGRKAWNFDEFEALISKSQDIIWLDGNKIDPRNILPAAEGMAYVSLHEGFGIPILEAMSCGVPVITSNLSSMPEVAGDAGILVDPNSVTEISAAFSTIILQDNGALIQAGFKRLKNFSWNESAEKIYNNLIF